MRQYTSKQITFWWSKDRRHALTGRWPHARPDTRRLVYGPDHQPGGWDNGRSDACAAQAKTLLRPEGPPLLDTCGASTAHLQRVVEHPTTQPPLRPIVRIPTILCRAAVRLVALCRGETERAFARSPLPDSGWRRSVSHAGPSKGRRIGTDGVIVHRRAVLIVPRTRWWPIRPLIRTRGVCFVGVCPSSRLRALQ